MGERGWGTGFVEEHSDFDHSQSKIKIKKASWADNDQGSVTQDQGLRCQKKWGLQEKRHKMEMKDYKERWMRWGDVGVMRGFYGSDAKEARDDIACLV